MGGMYTPPGGYNPIATQLNQGQQQQANAVPVPSMEASEPQLAQAETMATQQLTGGIQTPGFRTSVMNTQANFPGMQANYEDLARQLYNFDKMELQPKYGTSPGVPTDGVSYGRVGPSELQQLTPNSAANPTLFADNPKYAIASQTTTGGNILDLLDTLNSAISKEFTTAKGKYVSTVQNQKDLIGTIGKLLDRKIDERREQERNALEVKIARERMANDLLLKQMDLEGLKEKKKSDTLSALDKRAEELLDNIRNGGQRGSEAFSDLKKKAIDLGLTDITDDELWNKLGGERWKDDRSFEVNLAQKKAMEARYTTEGKAKAATAQSGYDSADKVLEILNKNPLADVLAFVPGQVIAPQYERARRNLAMAIGTIRSGANVPAKEAHKYFQFLPSSTQSEEQRLETIEALKKELLAYIEVNEDIGLTHEEIKQKYKGNKQSLDDFLE